MRIKNKQLVFDNIDTSLSYTFSILSFIVLATLTIHFFVPTVTVDAAEQTATDGYNSSTISVSNDNAVDIDITPTSEQKVYSATNTLNITNSCEYGATITLSTNSNSDTEAANNLIRTGADDLAKTITPTAGDNLIDNSWGFSIDNGETFHAVPAKDKTPATIYNSSSATSSAETVNIKYGVKLDTNIPSGNYSNDVLYTVAVKPECLRYQISWKFDGDLKDNMLVPFSLSYGEAFDLSKYIPIREGYEFNGWTAKYEGGSTDFTGSETAADLNPTNAGSITMTANWTPYDIRGISNMQDMTSTLCTNTPVDTVVTLKDTRDNNTYTVKKLKDGRCWMTDSLRIENKTITSADSNIPNNESFTIMPHYEGKVNATTPNNRSYESIVYIDSTYGGYYDYTTATAGWYDNKTTAPESVAAQDICPKGWSLPTNGNNETDFGKLYAKYNSTELLMGEPNFQLNGYYYYGYGIVSVGTETNYDTRSISTSRNYIYAMFMNSSGTVELTHNALISGRPLATGIQIRCIAK